MIEKITHIRNPLTVIAIFAGLAEVSGTVVLPFLRPETQAIYVWFLMAFPVLLVSLFFAVLYWKHTVLYAPSDYRDDENFTKMFEAASPYARLRKMEAQVSFEELLPPGPSASDTPTTAPAPTATETAGDTPDADVKPVAPEHIMAAPAEAKEWFHFFARSHFTNSLLTELGISFVEQLTKRKFQRNVSPRELPRIVFDGVWSDGPLTTVVEVAITKSQEISKEFVERPFARVQTYVQTLSPEKFVGFECVIVYILQNYNTRSASQVARLADSIKNKYPFKTDVQVMSSTALGQFAVGDSLMPDNSSASWQ